MIKDSEEACNVICAIEFMFATFWSKITIMRLLRLWWQNSTRNTMKFNRYLCSRIVASASSTFLYTCANSTTSC